MKYFRKSLLWILLLPLVCIVFSAFKGDNRNFLLSKHLDIFHAVFRELDLMYVDTIDIAGTLEQVSAVPHHRNALPQKVY